MGFGKQTNQGQIVRTDSGSTGKKFFFGVVIVVLLIGTNAGLFMWQQRLVREAKQQAQTERQQKEDLEKKITALEAAQEESAAKAAEQTEVAAVSASQLESIVASKNYAELQSYLADSVLVILAASEGVGQRTPEQVPGDLAILNTATTPWNFALSSATLTEWRGGDYRQYFPEGVIAGQSTNNYVVAFQLNAEDKITTIFISTDAELL